MNSIYSKGYNNHACQHSIANLPREIIIEIFKYIKFPESASLLQVSKEFSKFSEYIDIDYLTKDSFSVSKNFKIAVSVNAKFKTIMSQKIVDLCLKSHHLNKMDAFRFAAEKNHNKTLVYLLNDNSFDPTVDDNYLLRIASYHGYERAVELLLTDKRVNPSSMKQYAIRMASHRGHKFIVDLLLQDYRVDPSANHNYAIIHASLNGHVDVVKRLLQDYRVDPSDSNCEAFRLALENKHTEVACELTRNNKVFQYAIKNGFASLCNQTDNTNHQN